MKIRIKKSKITPLDILALWVIYFFSYCTIDFMKTPVINIIGYGSFGLFIILCIVTDKYYLKRFFLISWPLLAFWLLLILLSSLTTSVVGINNYIRNILYMIIYIALYTYCSNQSKKTMRKVVVVVWAIDCFIINFNTIKQLIETPLLSRFMTTGNAYAYIDESISIIGVATFGGIYGLVMVVTAFFYLILLKNKKVSLRAKICMFIYDVVAIWTIIQAQFTIALLLIGMGIGFSIWNYPNRKKTKNIKSTIIIVLVAIALLFNGLIIDIIVNSNFFPETINIRLEEIKLFLSFSEISGTDLLTRLSLYTESIKSIIKTFGLGIILVGKGEVGGHSELLDGFANYGILLFALVLYFFTKYYKVVKNKLSNQIKNGWFVIYVIFGIEALVNTAFWARQTEVVLLIVPLVFMMYSEKTEDNSLINLRGKYVEDLHDK